MMLLPLLVLDSLLPSLTESSDAVHQLPAPRRQVRWWSSHLEETMDLLYQHSDAITGVAPCCGGPSVHANGSFVPGGLQCDVEGNAIGTDGWASAFVPLGVTVEWFSQLDTDALVDNTADKAIDAMVKCVVNTNLTGLIFDVEDFHGNPNGRQHAELYAGWLGRLAEAMHTRGKTVGVCVSDWGILQYYDLYAAANLDSMMTMATYYNMAPASNNCSLCPTPIKSWANRSKLWDFWLNQPHREGVATGVMSAGVGQMTVAGCGCKNGTIGCCNGTGWPSQCHEDRWPAQPNQQCGLTDKLHAARSYDGCHALGDPGQCFFWTQPDLRAFTDWLHVNEITSIDIWRADLSGCESLSQQRLAQFGLCSQVCSPQMPRHLASSPQLHTTSQSCRASWAKAGCLCRRGHHHLHHLHHLRLFRSRSSLSTARVGFSTALLQHVRRYCLFSAPVRFATIHFATSGIDQFLQS